MGKDGRGLSGRTRRIALGSGALLGSTLVTFVSGFTLAGVMARGFSPEEFGLWGILVSLNGIFMNGFDWGFGNALRNRIAQLKARGEPQGARVYFFSVFSWFMANGAALTALFWMMKPWLPWGALLNTGNAALVRTGSLLFAMGCSTFALNIAFNIYSPGFFGFGESHWNACFNTLSKLSVLAVTVLLVLAGAPFILVGMATFLAILGSSMVGFTSFLVLRGWAFVVVGFRKTFGVVRELWRKSALFALLQVCSLLLLNGDLLVVSFTSGLEATGDYFVVKRLFLVLSTLHFALLLPIWSEYTAAIESFDHAWARGVLGRTAWLTCMLFGIGGACLVVLGKYVVLVWTGREMGTPGLFFWLGIWSLIFGWNNCFSVFLNAVGRLRRQAVLAAAGAAVFIPLGAALGRQWGAVGICWALILVSVPVAFSNPVESFQFLREYEGRVQEATGG